MWVWQFKSSRFLDPLHCSAATNEFFDFSPCQQWSVYIQRGQNSSLKRNLSKVVHRIIFERLNKCWKSHIWDTILFSLYTWVSLNIKCCDTSCRLNIFCIYTNTNQKCKKTSIIITIKFHLKMVSSPNNCMLVWWTPFVSLWRVILGGEDSWPQRNLLRVFQNYLWRVK